MPSSWRRASAAASRLSRIRSPALSWVISSVTESHSGVAYSGWEPTSRYSRALFSRNTLEERPHETTRRNMGSCYRTPAGCPGGRLDQACLGRPVGPFRADQGGEGGQQLGPVPVLEGAGHRGLRLVEVDQPGPAAG